ncbi:MAG: hypothetical protein HFH39_11740 [Lachnospiraceae bacterium]|nr:hypothetical protein [Bacilli bacterium]MCI9005879.1 hypothetical protein [Lachnospiraceae bacterium]
MYNWHHNYYCYKALAHHGIKGQKWGVKNGPPYPLDRKDKNKVKKTEKPGIIKTTITGHSTPPKQSAPNSIIDHLSDKGNIKTRGLKKMEIHTSDHGNRKCHNYGNHGEHGHDYEWDDDGRLKSKKDRELSPKEREENKDIL